MAEDPVGARDLSAFEFGARAGLYEGNGGHRRKGLAYRGFSNAALAVQYAMEEMPPSHAVGAVLEVDEQRYTMLEVVALYDGARYPLIRRRPAERKRG